MSNEFAIEALSDGRLCFQACKTCAHAWLPARKACPSCLSRDLEHRDAGGRGTILSWVTYHHAFADNVRDLVPYTIAIVRLDEGPQLLANLEGSDPPVIGSGVIFVPPGKGEPAIYRFTSVKKDVA